MIKITKFKDYIINSEQTIRQSVVNLGKLKKNFCIVVDSNNKYVGTLTDGDIRRGLLLNFTLKDKVKDACNRNSKFVSKIASVNKIQNIFQKKKYSFFTHHKYC